MIYSPIKRILYSPISRMIYSPISRMIYIPLSRKIYKRRARRVPSCVWRARQMLSSVAAGNAAINGKLAAASEDGRRRKLASMAQRFFAPSAPRGTMHVLICYVQHGWSSAAVSTPVTILYSHYHQSQPSSHNGLFNSVGAYKSP